MPLLPYGRARVARYSCSVLTVSERPLDVCVRNDATRKILLLKIFHVPDGDACGVDKGHREHLAYFRRGERVDPVYES